MTKNKICHVEDHIFFLGVPARKLAVGLSAATPQALAMGLMVAGSSFLRSLCRSLCPKAPAFAGFPLQSLTQRNSIFLFPPQNCHILTVFILKKSYFCRTNLSFMTDFKSKYGPWALVAGASEGLGAAFAEELAKRGLNLILIARRLDKLELLANDLKNKYKIETRFQSLDLADFQQVGNYISQLNIPVGLMVYNAAFAPIGYFEEIPEESLEKIINVNIKTPLLLSKLMSTQMTARRKGGIVLMSSLAGTQGTPKLAAYAATKSFNAILAEGLWKELKKYDIDVIASVAGAIRTPGYQNAQNTKDAPGTLDASEVAIKTLNALGKVPVTIPGFINKLAGFFMGRMLPTKMAISIMDKQTKKLS